MKTLTTVAVTFTLFSFTALAQAGDPWNDYTFTLDPTLSTINISVTMTLPGYGGQTQSTQTTGRGTVQSTLWQSGQNHDIFSQMKITDLELLANSNPSMTFKWKVLFVTIETATATASNLAVYDLDESDTYTRPVGGVDAAGSFTLPSLGINVFGDVVYNASGLYSTSGSLSMADYNPNYTDLTGTVVKNSSGVKLVSSLDVTGTQDLGDYIPGASADYHVVAHLETAYTSFLSVIPGDANCDRKVDVSDLGILAANYGQSAKTWTEGNFTSGDDRTDVSDLGILAAHYGQSTGILPVPEPFTLTLLAFGSLAIGKKN